MAAGPASAWTASNWAIIFSDQKAHNTPTCRTRFAWHPLVWTGESAKNEEKSEILQKHGLRPPLFLFGNQTLCFIRPLLVCNQCVNHPMPSNAMCLPFSMRFSIQFLATFDLISVWFWLRFSIRFLISFVNSGQMVDCNHFRNEKTGLTRSLDRSRLAGVRTRVDEQSAVR